MDAKPVLRDVYGRRAKTYYASGYQRAQHQKAQASELLRQLLEVHLRARRACICQAFSDYSSFVLSKFDR